MDQKKKKLIWQVPFLLVLIIGTVIIVSQQRNMPYQKNTGLIFGTEYHIIYQSDEDLQKEIEEQMNHVNSVFSTFDPKSEISRINKNEDFRVSDSFVYVYNLAEKVSKETHGAFDVTVAPLVNLWGFGFKQGQQPNKHAVDSIMPFIGFDKVRMENRRIVKANPHVMLDFAAIAKGYGCDVVANYLRSHGVSNFMVEIGGEVVTSGISEKRTPWKIGITKPNDDPTQSENELQTILNVTDKAMATSGNYRNFYYKAGRKYAHTIDPKTGYPVQHNILSATVLANDCATADAYATSFMVMGMEGAQQVLKKHPELMVYLIYTDKQGKYAVWYSPSLKDKIEI